MFCLKNKKHRAGAALAIALLASLLIESVPARSLNTPPAAEDSLYQSPVLAWWGTLYPGFCFSEKPEKGKKIKTVFWIVEFLEGVGYNMK